MEDLRLLSVFANWIPFILVFVVILYFRRRDSIHENRNEIKSGGYLKEQLEEIRRLNQNLERIAHALEERADNSK